MCPGTFQRTSGIFMVKPATMPWSMYSRYQNFHSWKLRRWEHLAHIHSLQVTELVFEHRHSDFSVCTKIYLLWEVTTVLVYRDKEVERTEGEWGQKQTRASSINISYKGTHIYLPQKSKTDIIMQVFGEIIGSKNDQINTGVLYKLRKMNSSILR